MDPAALGGARLDLEDVGALARLVLGDVCECPRVGLAALGGSQERLDFRDFGRL